MRLTLLATVLLVVAAALFGYTYYEHTRIHRDYDRRLEIYTLRENVLRLDYFQAMDDRVGISSTILQIRDAALNLGDSLLISLADSLSMAAKKEPSRMNTYSKALLSYTEEYLSRPMPKLPLWAVVAGFLIGALAVVLLITDIIMFRRGVSELIRYVKYIRMGLFRRRMAVKGDFSRLSEALEELADDAERTRKNARQLIQP
ncbi:MAG: hypothetical protein GXO29_04050 [Thermotogae bacterium]|nr:hypothetical protein [Thermotogota bacterium]